MPGCASSSGASCPPACPRAPSRPWPSSPTSSPSPAARSRTSAACSAARCCARLMDLKLVTVTGRAESMLGRPLLYATTEQFLHRFGLGALEDLPKKHEFGA
ncbi:MAG: SMC-Scp complex subunit ScpB [Minicystis sp.]